MEKTGGKSGKPGVSDPLEEPWLRPYIAEDHDIIK
jgi:hypothetical protein